MVVLWYSILVSLLYLLHYSEFTLFVALRIAILFGATLFGALGNAILFGALTNAI